VGGLLEAAVRDPVTDQRFYGVTVAEVIGNIDTTGLGRVQVRLPWLSGYQPWARVAMPAAGQNRGTYFIPQVGDEVLVAFNHGDVREPFVVGSLWNGRDQPPRTGQLDPTNTRVIRTPAGHEIAFDDTEQSIVVLTSSGQRIAMDANQIELSAGSGAAKITLTTAGEITIDATKVAIKAASQFEVKGTTVEVNGDASATFKSGGLCTVQGSLVKIN
jgi:phage baseplate assembly protein V